MKTIAISKHTAVWEFYCSQNGRARQEVNFDKPRKTTLSKVISIQQKQIFSDFNAVAPQEAHECNLRTTVFQLFVVNFNTDSYIQTKTPFF